MCGRFAITLPDDAMVKLFQGLASNDLPQVPNYNVCPTNEIHTVTSDAQTRRIQPMRWGFLPHWYKAPNGGPLLINARAETLAQKSAFRDAARTRRCLIPVTGFYEWTKTPGGDRLPWYIHPTDKGPLVFAGVWQNWSVGDVSLSTCAIVTCAANESMSRIHHRMPVVLGAKDWALWLGEEGHGAATLMTAAPDDCLTFYRVDTAANSNRAKGPQLIAPLSPPTESGP